VSGERTRCYLKLIIKVELLAKRDYVTFG